jgi:hypothetical protein
MRGLVPRISLRGQCRAFLNEMAGTSPAMTIKSQEMISQLPNTSLKKRAIAACDCVLARASSAFFGVEKPCLVPL